MCPKNETADLINDYVIHQLPGDGISLLGADSVEGSAAFNFPKEYLNSITPNGMPPHRLFLKMFATVILLRNLDLDEGLCNGTRLIIRAFSKQCDRRGDHNRCTQAQASVYTPNYLDIIRVRTSIYSEKEAVSYPSSLLYHHQQRARSELGNRWYISSLP